MAPALIQEVEEDENAPQTIELTEVETTLCRLLLDVAKFIDSNPSNPDTESQVHLPEKLQDEPIVLRITGGWVRDKLLGVLSHDIDVAINKMTGYQFGLRLKEYLEIPGNPEKYGLEGVATTERQSQKAGASDKSKTVGGLHKIEANPEKSKHLETVTTKILGLDIDLVNLRKETYTDDSRNPQMEFGTPEEDALRRDATVNAMFYNINTAEIEDFTGRGHEDLKANIIRTPLEPYQTFKDDPLRVLRLIRFSSRLGAVIDMKAQQAMRNSEIKEALEKKISRERVGIEVEKALRGPDPHEAMRLIFELGLYDTIFCDPTLEAKSTSGADIEGWKPMIDYLQDLVDGDNALSQNLIRDDEDRFLAWQLAALVPYDHVPLPEPSGPGRKPPPPIPAQVAREGIKSTNKVCEIIAAAVRNQNEVTELVDKLYEQQRRPDKKIVGEDAQARDVLGMAVRRWGPSWRTQVLFAMLAEVASDPNAADAIRRRYTAFVDRLQKLELLDAHLFKPLMDGKTLAATLKTPPGPWMKDALDVVMAYQLRNPDTASAEAAIEEVRLHLEQQDGAKKNGGELTSSLVRHFLSLTIRPLFIKAKPSSVTDTGRKNTTTVLPPKMTANSNDETLSKPWKNGKEADVLNLLQWCVAALDGKLVEEVWHLLIPPVLTLVDDWEAKYKTLGARLVGQILKVTPPSLLSKTGLADVFEEALMPCLTYLPTITPEAESIPLLNAAYDSLLILSRVQYAVPAPVTTTPPKPMQAAKRIKCLDTILRKGIIYGYTHCSSLPNIVALLFRQLAAIVKELGIHSVKHLQYILPMLTETLSHPFARSHIPAMLSATKALQAVILNGWPRMAHHRGEVLREVCFGWLNAIGSEGDDVEELRMGLRKAVEMLKVAVQGEVDIKQDFEVVLKAEPRLEGLFEDGAE